MVCDLDSVAGCDFRGLGFLLSCWYGRLSFGLALVCWFKLTEVWLVVWFGFAGGSLVRADCDVTVSLGLVVFDFLGTSV